MIESFKPIVNDDCEVLILGSMPGVESLRKQQYYGYERNQFWKIIFSLFDGELSQDYQKKKELLLKNHIALWDVLKSCDREGSSDSKIKNPIANDFKWLFSKYPKLRIIYFNGKTAEKFYERFVDKNISINVTRSVALPSTSPANAMQYEIKLKQWEVILHSINKE